MSRRRHTPEQIITALREAEVGLANGKTVAMVSRELGISEQTYYRPSMGATGRAGRHISSHSTGADRARPESRPLR